MDKIFRAFSTFEIKAADDDRRLISGVATTPSPDRYGDTVDPKGAKFSLPLPLLWQHNSVNPVGHVLEASVSAEGINVVARIAKPEGPPALVERMAEYWAMVKEGLVRGFSIGFRGMPDGVDIDAEKFTFNFREWEWLELSLVTIPANADATISAVRSFATAPELFDVVRDGAAPAALTVPEQRVIRLDSDTKRRAGLRGVVFK